MKELNVKIENGTQELEIRTGSALEIKPPQSISISGDINTVANFLVKRDEDNGGFGTQEVDKTKIVVVVNKKERSIKMQLDPENYYGATITGTLELSDELKKFTINEPQTYNREQLVKFIRFNRRFFENPDKHQTVLDSYQSFNVQAHLELTQNSDQRGNKTNLVTKKVTTGLPEDFILFIPIFKGQQKETFRVEICLDVTDGGAKFWFESVELAELIEARQDEIFTEQLKHCTQFVVINQ